MDSNNIQKLNDVADKYELGKISWVDMVEAFKEIMLLHTGMPIHKVTNFEFSIFLLVLMVRIKKHLDGEKSMVDFNELME